MMRASLLFALLLCAGAVAEGEHAKVAINPIRRVVSMLQMMQKKIAAEGDAEKELYEKFMCWCKTGGSALAKSIADAEAKIP
jgi:cytochrome c5